MKVGDLVKDKRDGSIGVVLFSTDDAIWFGVQFTSGKGQTIHKERLEVICK